MIFQNFQPTDIVSGRIQSVSTPVWSNGNPTASVFYTSSAQTAPTGSTSLDVLNGAYYWNVYDQDPSISNTAEVQFSIAYGNINGSGSLTNPSSGSTMPTVAVYNQFKNLILDPNDPLFTFQLSGSAAGTQSNDIYSLSFATSRFKDELDAGAIQFNLAGTFGNFSFIDDSTINPNSSYVYNIVSGSIIDGVKNIYANNGQGFGLFYSDLGIIILNPSAIANVVGPEITPTYYTDQYYQNQKLLLNSLNSGSHFQALSTEFVPTTNYFIRVGNQSFNYSNNPTFVSSSNGVTTFRFPQFSSNPQVYVTTIGLYDDNNNLVAVAKLSQPTLKTFDTEILAKVRLNF